MMDTGTGTDSSSSSDSGADASGDSPAETATGDGAPWSPSNFTGLALWLNDTIGVVQDTGKPGYVRRWLDQSGNSNTADVPGYQSCEPSIDPAVLNGYDAIIMDNSSCNFVITDATSLQFGTGDFLVGAVVKVPSYATNELYIWDKSPYYTGLFLYQDTSNNFVVSINTDKATIADPDTTKFHIVIVQGAALSLFVDTLTAAGSTNTMDISFAGTNVSLMSGANNGVGGFELAEMVAVKGTVSAADLANLQGYFTQKFKL
jgi:hypothetical protein